MPGTDPIPLEARVPIGDLIAGLARPEAHGLPEGTPVRVVQTHASAVFIAGGRAVKVKKPVRFWDLLDYGTFAAREHCCHEEVRLNRRLAPDVYLGVEPIVKRADGALYVGGAGDVVEHAVVMLEIDEADTLGARLERGAVTPADIDAVADRIAAFHLAHRLDDESPAALAERFDVVLRRNFEGTPVADNDLFPTGPHLGLAARLGAQLDRTRDTLEARVAAGRAVDGHGDIRLDHVLRTAGGWGVMDCVEFSETLRHIDGASDLSFLSMDLVAAGHPDLADRLEQRYAEAASDPDMHAVLPLFRGYRAYVRATVDYYTSRETEIPAATRVAKATNAKRYFALAWTESLAGLRPPVIVLRGTSGSGKSRLARAIAPMLRARVIQSDVVRKALLGMAPTERPDQAGALRVYSSEMSERTYAELLARARLAVRAGACAILDATYLFEASRAEVRALASELGAPFVILDISADADVIRTRLAARGASGDDASDADYEIYLDQVQTAEPITAAEVPFTVSYDSTTPPMPLLMELLCCVERQLEGSAR